MNRGLIVALAVAVLLIGGYAVYSGMAQTAPAPTETNNTPAPTAMPQAADTMTPSPAATTSAMTVSITATGYEPKSITVMAGDTVTWTNNDTKMRNVSSAAHPTHLVYPPLNLGNIQPGESKSLSFPTAGSYNYHDHIYSQFFGTVVVQ